MDKQLIKNKKDAVVWTMGFQCFTKDYDMKLLLGKERPTVFKGVRASIYRLYQPTTGITEYVSFPYNKLYYYQYVQLKNGTIKFKQTIEFTDYLRTRKLFITK